MRVLLVQCYLTDKPWGHMMLQSFVDNIQRTRPSAQVDVCEIEAGETPPDPSSYDLVIMSGGTFNLVDDPPVPWVESALEYVRTIAKMEAGPKLLGLCWGHQATQMALGGKLKSLGGAQVGVEKLALSPEGKTFFSGQNGLSLHKFHRRAVETRAADFRSLAQDNEILVSSNGRILSFQSHPELDYPISQDLVRNAHSYTDLDPAVVLEPIDSKHDGQAVWARIMDWVGP